MDYKQLIEQENKEFGDLCEMAGRFSDDEDELKISNIYYSKKSILEKVRYIKWKLKSEVPER